MPNTSYSDALAEVATLAPQGEVMLRTIEISHPVAGRMLLVDNREDWAARDENNVPQTFQASSFTLGLPDSGDKPIQHLDIAIPNIDRAASDYLALVPLESTQPVVVTYRVYLSNGGPDQTPHNNPPLVMHLMNIQVDVFQVTGRGSFQSIINTKYPSELYSLEKFPPLGN